MRLVAALATHWNARSRNLTDHRQFLQLHATLIPLILAKKSIEVEHPHNVYYPMTS
jgi:hypothetical protein